ncbi:MAG: SIS domain-containing protein [Chloroflexi bacterium]|nr:SIS domain-containing protein [Chloroflexota bacterium]
MDMQTRQTIQEVARRVLEQEAQAVANLTARLGPEFERAAELILTCKGRVVVTGIGKSGHIARKLAATLASTGTPAFFMHAAEALHGDSGMVTADDVVMVLSHSGASDEIINLLVVLREIGAPIIAMTSRPDSPLAEVSTVVLNLGVTREADPRGLAPTSSTIAMLALGDALAIAVSVARGFTAVDFLRLHPGGTLGRLQVQDLE